MDRIVCALFDTEEQANSAVNNLLEGGLAMDRDLVSVLVHKDTYANEDVEIPGTKSRIRLFQGAALGAVSGAIIGGAILGPLGVVGVEPLAAAVFGASSGVVYGAVAGALTGRDARKKVVKRLAREVENGRVLITVEVEDQNVANRVVQGLRGAGSLEVQLV